MANSKDLHTFAAITGTTAGIVLLFVTTDYIAIGGTLAILGALTAALTRVRAWITDTAAERAMLRDAIAEAEDSRRSAQIAEALTSTERERARARIAAAEERARQAEINADQRARAAERDEKKRADARIIDEVNKMRQQFEETRAKDMVDAYSEGVTHALSGQIDLIDERIPQNLVRLEDRRPTKAAVNDN